MYGKSPSITTDPNTVYKIKVNNCDLIDFVIRLELTRAILMSRFSNFPQMGDLPYPPSTAAREVLRQSTVFFSL